jgi:hypothetical protein
MPPQSAVPGRRRAAPGTPPDDTIPLIEATAIEVPQDHDEVESLVDPGDVRHRRADAHCKRAGFAVWIAVDALKARLSRDTDLERLMVERRTVPSAGS